MERGPIWKGHDGEPATKRNTLWGGVWREARIKRHGMTPRHERERGDIAP